MQKLYHTKLLIKGEARKTSSILAAGAKQKESASCNSKTFSLLLNNFKLILPNSHLLLA